MVVFALGTNGAFTSEEMRQLVQAVGPRRELVLVNTYEARPWEAEVNQVIAATAHRYRNVVVANWFTTIGHRTGLLWPDGVHPQPGGARLYARGIISGGPGRPGGEHRRLGAPPSRCPADRRLHPCLARSPAPRALTCRDQTFDHDAGVLLVGLVLARGVVSAGGAGVTPGNSR